MEKSNRAGRILIVDDVGKNIQLLANILSAAAFDFSFAMNGVEALKILEKNEFDLILLDIMMPGMDGYEVCTKIRATERHKDVPIIFLTAKNDKKSVVRGFQMGAQDYVSKPFSHAELVTRVNTQIELSRKRKELQYLNQHLEEKVLARTAELENANRMLEVLDQAKNEFLNIISHEIRTPLNGIIGLLSIIKEMVNNPEYVELFDILDKSCMRLESFALDALTISMLITKKGDSLNRKRLDIGTVIHDVLDEIPANQMDKHIIHKQVSSVEMNVDEKLIRKCVESLVLNAVKHSPENTTIKVYAKFDGQHYIISVTDEGKGFDESLIANGVKAFSSANHIDQNPGLELYLCKLIAEAHGGTMLLSNQNGARVQIYLPYLGD